MNKIGVFLGSGGNKVFFVNGVLKVFAEEKINLDHLIGLSSSSAVLFIHLLNCHEHSLDIFGNRLKKNKHNFYFNKKEKFPHNKIYKSAITEMFNTYGLPKNNKISYTIIATQTEPKSKKIKGLIATLVMGLKFLKINILPGIKKILEIKPLYIQSDEIKKMSQKEITNLIMGSSTIYPFIKLNVLNEKLILEGDLAEVDPIKLLAKFDKKIIIHTTRGNTEIKNNILHIYSSQPIPNDILDYTDDTTIRTLYENGKKDTQDNLDLIKNYLSEKL